MKVVSFLFIAFLSQSAFANKFCGTVSITHTQLGSVEPLYTLDVPNNAIPEGGYSTNYVLLDNNTPILKQLIDGKFVCLEGALENNGMEKSIIVIEILSQH